MATVEAKEISEYEIVHFQLKQFNITNKEDYYKTFNEYVDNKIIKKGSKFEDANWVYSHKSEEKRITFPKEITYKRLEKILDKKSYEIEIALKSFTLYNLDISLIDKFLATLRRFSNGSLKKSSITEMGLIKSFIEYIGVSIEKAEELEESFDDIEYYESYKNSVGRTLPNFIDIYLFRDIVDDIVFNKGIENYKKYLLVIMWWKITSILPLRPTEFLRTDYDCIIPKDESDDGTYKLKIKRTLLKGKKYVPNWHTIEGAYKEDFITIDEWVYNLIYLYKNILNNDIGYTENKELFPFELVKFSYGQAPVKERELNSNLTMYNDLRNNLKKFYNKVVKKEYGYIPISKFVENSKGYEEKYIKKLSLHDARHISIINLIYLGVDIYKVMILAGHENINTTMSYYEQMDEFARGSVFAFNKTNNMITSRKDSNEEFRDSGYLETHKSIMKERLKIAKGGKSVWFKVKGGHCTYSNLKNDLSNCNLYEVNHSVCPYFRPDNKKVIQDELKKTEKKYRTEVKILRDIIRDSHTIHRSNQIISVGIAKLQNLVNDMRVQNWKLYDEE